MKKTLLILMLVLLSTVSFSKEDMMDEHNKLRKNWEKKGFTVVKKNSTEKTLFGGKKVSHGGYGGPSLKVIDIDGKYGFMSGGEGAWIINHSIIIGGAGYGLVSDINVPGKEDYSLNMGYGGVNLGLVLFSDSVLHLTAETLLGSGGISYLEGSLLEHIEEDDFDKNLDQFWILEPGVNIELNMTRFFRIKGGVSYRFVDGIDENETYGFSDADLTGLSYNLAFKFGAF